MWAGGWVAKWPRGQVAAWLVSRVAAWPGGCLAGWPGGWAAGARGPGLDLFTDENYFKFDAICLDRMSGLYVL